MSDPIYVLTEADGSLPDNSLVQCCSPKVGVTPEGAILVSQSPEGDPSVVEGEGTAGSPAGGVVTVQSIGYMSNTTSTRPNDAAPYVANDVVGESPAANLVFANIGPSGGGKILITNLSMKIDVNAIPAGMIGFRLHLYDAAPTAIVDNAAYNLPAADRTKYLGFIELPAPVDIGDTLWAEAESMNLPVRKQITLPAIAAGSVWGIVQTLGAYTPSALTVRSVTLHSILLG
jgi:hypothetical protein